MSRSLQQRHILEQEHRIFDSIHLKGELNTLSLVVGIPVAESNGRQFSVGNGLRQAAGTRLCLCTVEMHHMAAGDRGRTLIYRGDAYEVLKIIRP